MVCPVCGTRRAHNGPSGELTDSGVESVEAPATTTDPFARRPAIQAELTVQSPLGLRGITLVEGDLLEIGREVGPLSDLCGDNISSNHADIRVGPAGAEIRDTGRDCQGSMNGTFLNGVRLAPNTPTRLQHGATIKLAGDPPMTIQVAISECAGD